MVTTEIAELGEIKKAKEIGKQGGNNYIYLACMDCGKERWVQYTKKGEPKNLRCHACAVANPEYKAKLSQFRRGKKGERSSSRIDKQNQLIEDLRGVLIQNGQQIGGFLNWVIERKSDYFNGK